MTSGGSGVALLRSRQLRRDPPLGLIGHLIGDARFTPAIRIFIPGLFRKVQLAVQQHVKRRRSVTRMHTGHAVVPLARRPAALTLHAGGLLALLQKAGLINDTHHLALEETPQEVNDRTTRSIKGKICCPRADMCQSFGFSWSKSVWTPLQLIDLLSRAFGNLNRIIHSPDTFCE